MPLQFSEEAITNDSPWEVEGSSKARLVQATPNIDQACAYIARVSSKKQTNPSVKGLLKYCAKHGHWSVFEQGYLTMEVVTPLFVATQLLRHRSFTFQQFSGRYQDQRQLETMTKDLHAVGDLFYMPPAARLQDPENRQNSIEIKAHDVQSKMWGFMEKAYVEAQHAYDELLKLGIAKEIARVVLPQSSYTRLYVTGNARSFIHYLAVRDDPGVAQWEHVELARAMGRVFESECPIITEAIA
jgi:thymidylate synthase (FAD)